MPTHIDVCRFLVITRPKAAEILGFVFYCIFFLNMLRFIPPWRKSAHLGISVPPTNSKLNPCKSDLQLSLSYLLDLWWTWPDSNRLPPACKAGVLPGELQAHKKSSYRCKPLQSHSIIGSIVKLLMATPNGLEPSTSCVTGRRSDQLNYGAI